MRFGCVQQKKLKCMKMRNNRAKSDTEMSKQYRLERHKTPCKVISKGINGLSKSGVW